MFDSNHSHVFDTDDMVEPMIILGDPDEDDFVVDESGNCYLVDDNSTKLLRLSSCLMFVGGTIDEDEITLRFASVDDSLDSILILRFTQQDQETIELVTKLFLDSEFPITADGSKAPGNKASRGA